MFEFVFIRFFPTYLAFDSIVESVEWKVQRNSLSCVYMMILLPSVWLVLDYQLSVACLDTSISLATHLLPTTLRKRKDIALEVGKFGKGNESVLSLNVVG